MDLSFIIYLVLFFAVVFLIFKFIKKVIFAVITVLVLVLLIVAGIGGLIYSDINRLTSYDNYDIKVLYAQGEEELDYIFGVSLPIENQSIVLKRVSGLSNSQIDDIDPDALDDKSNEFVVIVREDRFEELVVEESYDLNSVEQFDFSSFDDYDLTLSKAQVIDLVKSKGSGEMLVDILVEKNGLTEMEAQIARPIILEMIDSKLDEADLTLREALFMFIISDSLRDDKGIVNFVEGYKEGEIEVYPDRISFKFLRLLPATTIKSFLYDEDVIAEE